MKYFLFDTLDFSGTCTITKNMAAFIRQTLLCFTQKHIHVFVDLYYRIHRKQLKAKANVNSAQLKQQKQIYKQEQVFKNKFAVPSSDLGQPINDNAYGVVDLQPPINYYDYDNELQPTLHNKHYDNVHIQNAGIDAPSAWQEPDLAPFLDNTPLEWQPDQGSRHRRKKRHKNFWSFFRTKKSRNRRAHR